MEGDNKKNIYNIDSDISEHLFSNKECTNIRGKESHQFDKIVC